MQPFQQRVVDEKADLDLKIERLTAFTASDSFEVMVEGNEQRRMLRQLVAMRDYSRILGERIDSFGVDRG